MWKRVQHSVSCKTNSPAVREVSNIMVAEWFRWWAVPIVSGSGW